MAATYPARCKAQAETALGDARYDFIAKYHAVSDLRRLARSEPGLLDAQTIAAASGLLRSPAYDGMRQAYFLFRETAGILSDMATAFGANGQGRQAIDALQQLLGQVAGSAHRAVAEVLGSLPLAIGGPAPPRRPLTPAVLTWRELLALHGLQLAGAPYYVGRCLVAPTDPGQRLLVVKLARCDDCPAELAGEIAWMQHLGALTDRPAPRFHIPRPLPVRGHVLLQLGGLPLAPPPRRHPEGLAIAFLADPGYFVYPNQPQTAPAAAREMLARNSYLLGWLAGRGVIHTAPIPLFHNRTQRMRRDDGGRYQWYRAGRLDQWLDSCAFPNFGHSGLRDFEHFAPAGGCGRSLYRHLGAHLLSLLLVAGSYFRWQQRTLGGLDARRQPVDARHLFDPAQLAAMVTDIYVAYHRGFAGTEPDRPLPVDLRRLVARMIEEMGMDRHMTELLRRADQQALDEGQFRAFLRERGLSEEQLAGLTRGEKDIVITSGPHLGDFNRPISLPEIIEAVAAMAAMCVAGRFAGQRGSD